MKGHCPARAAGFAGFRPRNGMLLLPLVLGLVAGCAGQSTSSRHSTPPVTREVQQTELREQYDPRVHRSDEFLIEPTFAPPTVSGANTPARAPSDSTSVPAGPTMVFDGPLHAIADADTAVFSIPAASAVVYRVQVMVLSDEGTAIALANRLERDLTAPVQVFEDAGLFAVRAGDSGSAEVAADLREHIAALSSQYSEAFVMSEEVSVGASTAADEATPAALVSSDEPTYEPRLVRTTGWRVLLREFRRLEEATAFKLRVMRRLQRNDSDLDVIFEPPWYKVLLGHFRTEGEAQEAAERLREMGYRSAVKKRGEVYLPEENH